MPKITDEQYRYLSRAVYFVGKFPHQYRKGRMVTIHGRKYVVEDVESNEKNGLQALAVTPKDDPNELVIAYGGTDPADIRDALTDIEFIALGREHRPLEDGRDRLREVIAENPRVQELISRLGLDGTALLAARGSGDSQAVSALKFAHRAAGGRTFTTTGHSLGASLAIYVAVKLRMSSTCFNGPDISAILSAEECACIRSHPYEFRNYHNPGDIIGNVTPDRLDCAITAAGQRASLDILACHSLRSWHFSESGSVTSEDGRPLLGEEELSFCRKMQSGDPACSTFASFVSAASDRAVSEVRASSLNVTQGFATLPPKSTASSPFTTGKGTTFPTTHTVSARSSPSATSPAEASRKTSRPPALTGLQPPFAVAKNSEEQVRMCFEAYRAGDEGKVRFD